ncbi:helix-turn-helix domain-containing protein [Parashewanella spongiae]|nr:helix-turn-helix domain-containing protein [Parashewanella spongiae]MCL1079697.1 helix-turn-helix domain-containing protein [Parashewanella spongiae]
MNKLLSPQEVSDLLGVTIGTLAVWRSTGRYSLKYIKVGRLIMYGIDDVEHFLLQRKHEHTSLPCNQQ